MKTNMFYHKPCGWLFYIVVIPGFLSCTSTLYIAPKKVECTASSDQKCYLIRKTQDSNWIIHYEDIAGLDYEPGFSYRIKVNKSRVKNPPIGGSALKYSLVEVLERRDVTDDIEIEDLVEKEWKLEFLKVDYTRFGIEGKVPTLKFDRDGKISGNGGCNNFFGIFSLDGRTIKFGEMGSTKMFCEGHMELEDAYFKVLAIETRGLFNEGKLVLTGDGGNQMIFGYK